jgi:hypothetical protein
VTTAGDLAALLGGARGRVRTATATLRITQDPHALLRAWATSGPWQAEAAAGDPGVFGIDPEPSTGESRQWVDRAGDRAREERGQLVLIRDGARWWRDAPGIGPAQGSAPESSVEVAEALDRWTDPQALTRFLELASAGEEEAHGRRALRVTATARGDAFDASLTQLGWGAARWELLVDAERGMLLGTTAFNADGDVFRRVEAAALTVDQPLDDALFRPPAPQAGPPAR